MKRLSYQFALFCLVFNPGLSAPAHAYEIYDAGAFLHSPSVSTGPLGYLDGVFNDFDGSGIDITFTNTLNADGIGSLSWAFSNNTAATLSDVNLFGYLDGEIDPDLNSSFNEFGRLIAVAGSGSGDSAADSWEIDEPGFVFGDIYDNLFLGALDNSNAVPEGSEDDVAMALGFELGDILAGETWTMAINISLDNIGGLFHGDIDGGNGFYINGSVDINRAVPVNEPGSLALLLLGLAGVCLARKNNK